MKLQKAEAFARYYGCMCARFDPAGARSEDVKLEGWIIKHVEAENSFYNYKLILRPINQMTKEEAIEVTRFAVVYGDFKDVHTYKNAYDQWVVSWGTFLKEKYLPSTEKFFTPEQLNYLIKQSFDVYDLEKQGIALYDDKKERVKI